MKIEIERYLNLTGYKENAIDIYDQFNCIISDVKAGEDLLLMADNYPDFWFYRGGSHIAVHQVIDGKPSNKRLLLITF